MRLVSLFLKTSNAAALDKVILLILKQSKAHAKKCIVTCYSSVPNLVRFGHNEDNTTAEADIDIIWFTTADMSPLEIN